MDSATRKRKADEDADQAEPSAGTTSAHPAMKRWEALLGRLGSVVTFDYPKPFSNHKRLVEKHAAVIAAIDNAGQRDIYLVGHSMGGRIACHVVTESSVVAANACIKGVVCLAFPLVAANGASRADVLATIPPALRTLFLSGTRDKMCPWPKMEAAVESMAAAHELVPVDTADHGLHVLKRASITQEQCDELIYSRIKAFVRQGRAAD